MLTGDCSKGEPRGKPSEAAAIEAGDGAQSGLGKALPRRKGVVERSNVPPERSRYVKREVHSVVGEIRHDRVQCSWQ
jgi:hypothetical protein